MLWRLFIVRQQQGYSNPIEAISTIVKRYNKLFIVDAMSNFGGIPIDMDALNIDVLISSSNKCIQGVPGFGFMIFKKNYSCVVKIMPDL